MIYSELINKLDFEKNIDLFLREIKEENFSYKLIFLSSLIDENLVMDLQRSIRFANNKKEIISKLDSIKVTISSNVEEILLLLYEGQVVISVDNENEVILVDVKKIPVRGIQEPETEKSIRGSRDGFNESLINNISLLRMRIKSSHLNIEAFRIGEISKTSLCILYLKDKVDIKNLEFIKKKINRLELDSLIMGDKALEEKIFSKKSIFPLVRYSERPDVTSIYLLKGHIIILVDTSSSSMIVPISIFDHMKNVEEYRQNTIIGNFIKVIRYVGIILSLLFIPICYLLAINENISNVFNSYLENTSSIPLSLQFIIGFFVIELFRIAIIHTPNTLSSALSIVIGIILGEVSMSLGLFLKDVLLVLSLGTIFSFSLPSYELSLTNRVLSFFMLLVSIFFGNIGFLIFLIILFIHLLSIKILDYPYLYPLIPLDFSKLKEKMIRTNSKNNKKL